MSKGAVERCCHERGEMCRCLWRLVAAEDISFVQALLCFTKPKVWTNRNFSGLT